MATRTGIMQSDLRKEDSLVIVRRFTDELQGETALERATVSAQQQQDATERADRRMRLQALYQDPDGDPRDFPIYEMDSAGLALQKVCEQLESTEKPSAWAKLGFHRRSARATANEAMLNMAAQDFGDLRRIVQGFESTWKGNQSNIGTRFRNVCDKLEGFKGAFAIFPSETMYTSVLCGSLSLIVSAAANHNDIAELLSEAVADIADKASRAAALLLIYPKNSTLHRMFAGLYANVFLFYRDTIQWYTESKLVRGFKTFDSGLKERYQKAKAKIESCLNEIYQVGGVAHIAEECFKRDLLEEKIDRMRQQMQQMSDACDQLFAGQAAQRTLRTMVESAYIEAPVENARVVLRTQAQGPKTPNVGEGNLSRTDARAFNSIVKQFVVGTEGPSLFKAGKFWLPEVDISFKLGEWISPNSHLSTLWISSPASSKEFPSSRAAAMVAAVAAWDSALPVISHFCERPRVSDVPDGRGIEEVGLIGLVYSLISQLLQFNVKDDAFQISRGQLEKLNGSDESWIDALLVLRDLLRMTPHLQRCIIDGLNDVCFSSGAEWCSSFLEMLFEHQRTFAPNFKILLTTNGQSRVLPDHVRAEDRAFVQRGARALTRGGRWLNAAERQTS